MLLGVSRWGSVGIEDIRRDRLRQLVQFEGVAECFFEQPDLLGVFFDVK